MTEKRVGYLGPRGTFTEAALEELLTGADRSVETVPYPTVVAVLDAVRAGEVAQGVVPIENSLEGPVTTTLDALARNDDPLVIVAEHALPVRFALLVREGTSLTDIDKLATMPIAAAQCRRWLEQHIPQAQVIAASSTASAAKYLGQDSDVGYQAAISPEVAAGHYGLKVLASGIGDDEEASTRFVLVSKPIQPPARTGADKTTLMLFMRQDHSGALLEILTELAVRGVNLTRIESRPTRKQLGDYYFSVDAEGHVDDERVAQALTGLRRVCSEVRYLGSYPRHDGKKSAAVRGTTDKDFHEADAWISAIRARGSARTN